MHSEDPSMSRNGHIAPAGRCLGGVDIRNDMSWYGTSSKTWYLLCYAVHMHITIIVKGKKGDA